jgi:YidC/Oxa1 family membrane protein insertase
MFLTFWHALCFDPIYNLLIFILDHVPGGDLGVAIIILTVLIKLILLPLSLRAAKTQYVMRTLEPELASIKEKHNGDRERLARETMDAYKNAGINPFASIFLTFIQLPIIFALYFSVSRGGGVPFPHINTALLYSFIPAPTVVNMIFLGLVDIAARNWPLALLAGITQFFQTKISLPALPSKKENTPADTKPSFKDDFARSMQMQMRYVMPVIIFFVAYRFSATIALYFLVSNIMAIAQEFVVHRHISRAEAEKK